MTRRIAALVLLGVASLLAAQTATTMIVYAPVSDSEEFQVVSPPPPPPPQVSPDETPNFQAGRGARLSGPASYSISGVVVSATTGAPVDRAEVSLTTPGTRGTTIDHGTNR